MKESRWKNTYLFIIVLLAAVLLSGCESTWNRANKGFLERDIRMLLDEKCRVRVAKIECRMLGTTRNAVGVFNVSSEQIEEIIRGLELKEAIEGSDEAGYIESILSSGEHQNLGELEPFSGVGARRYCSKRRSEELVLGNEVSFEYFVLFVDPFLDSVCVLLSYAYG